MFHNVAHIFKLQEFELSDQDEEEEGMQIADIEFKLSHNINEMEVRWSYNYYKQMVFL